MLGLIPESRKVFEYSLKTTDLNVTHVLNLSSEDVIVDLRGLKPGTHTVKLKYNSPVKAVDYKLDPSVATVRIYEKMSESKKIGKEVLYENLLNYFGS